MLKYDSPVELPRKLGPHAMVVLYLLQAAAQASMGPVTAQWLEDNSPGYANGSITKALRKLTSPEVQLAIKVNGGWIANTENTFQLPLGYSRVEDQNHAERDSAFPGGQVVVIVPQPEKSGITLSVIPSSENVVEAAFLGEKTGQNHAESDSARSLVKESLESLNLEKDLTYLDSQKKKKLLSQAGLLFDGKSVTWNDAFATREMGEILGWLAEIYDNKAFYDRPYGMVYNGLLRNLKLPNKQPDPDRRPEPKYISEPFAYLPHSYLDAVGLGKYYVERCGFCGGQGGRHLETCRISLNDHSEPEIETVESTDDTSIDHPLEGSPIAEAWQKCLDALKVDMARASFETWVKDTVPINWNSQTGALTVRARNNYGRNWLHEHIAGSSQELLTALLERPVNIQFVVRDE